MIPVSEKILVSSAESVSKGEFRWTVIGDEWKDLGTI
jgi:hypothetical protein